ncbi:hypothetical protein C4J81_02345 [Deltaproteobacteria bacterium Smac51]|nr:hypothetical protein C4J81_02345 [Deltaproteobacteria bacterium Smac51]
MEKKKYLTTGQFAKMCGTTKDTLFHYDREGILKPKLVSANGYRRYQAEQFFEFDLICVLKDAGSSLEDIRGYMSGYDAEHLLTILDEKTRDLENQQRRVAKRLQTIKHISKVTRSALVDNYGEISIEEHEMEYLLAEELELTKGQEISWDETALYMSRHFNHCEEAGVSTIFPVGGIIPLGHLQNGIFTESHFFSTIDHWRENSLIKPAGRYAVFIHKGSYDNLMAAMPHYLAEIRKRGLDINGPAYLYALLSYLASSLEENDVHKVAVKIE